MGIQGGEKRSAIRVVLDNFEFVDSGRSESSTPSSGASLTDANLQTNSLDTQPSQQSDLDEDVPF